jgi:probable HAF family extracellular repeat protein
MKRFSGMLAVLAALLGSTARADYVITDLGTFGGTVSEAFAINRSGQVVGDATIPGDHIYYAYLFSNGVKQNLGTLGVFPGAYSSATALNNVGQVVGDANASSPAPPHVFLYSNGVMRDLGTMLGGDRGEARGINDSGQIVGFAALGNRPVTTDLFTPSCTATEWREI